MPNYKTLSSTTLAAVCAVALLLAGCAASQQEHRQAVHQLRNLYIETLDTEQLRYGRIPVPPRSLEFWSLYAAERDRTSQGVVLRELRHIITENGVAALLFDSTTAGFRTAADDELINEMVLTHTSSSPQANKVLVEDPVIRERMRLAARGRRIDGKR